jgi:hypothetical protein
MVEWGANPSGNGAETLESLERRRQNMKEFVRKKERRPHHSQIHGGKFEIMSADDDPINQVAESHNYFLTSSSKRPN